MISAVAEMYEIHPQTLRLYEREGLLKPSRTEGNTRLYTDEDLERLEFILNLARDLGVNIAGIGIILQMRERMEEMNRQMQSFVEYVRTEMLTRFQQAAPGSAGAIVPIRRPTVVAKARRRVSSSIVGGRAHSCSVKTQNLAASRIRSLARRPRQVFLILHVVRSSWIGRFRAGHAPRWFAAMVLWAVPGYLRERRAALAANGRRGPGFTPPLTLLKPCRR